MKEVVIYTDGACLGNPGRGGWGSIIFYDGQSIEISGHKEYTTNNQMEITAAIEALQKIQNIQNVHQVILYTDSVYLKNGITLWIHKWKMNGWRTYGKSFVKNVELWQQLDKLSNKYSINWQWVKAHSNNFYNNLVDKLARDAASLSTK